MVQPTNDCQNPNTVKRRGSKATRPVANDETNSYKTDQSMCMGGTKIMLRRKKKRQSFVRSIRNSFRGLSKRSIFGESHAVSNKALHHEESIDFDVNSDDEEEIKAPIIKTKKLVKESAPTGGDEECTVTTKDSGATEDGIPKFIYVVNGNILTKLGKRNPIKRIQRSFRKAMPKKHEVLDESDEEAYDQTLVEL